MRKISILILLFCQFLCAATFHVNNTHGNDSNPGSADLPFATIQKAADVMQPGDVCMIRKGLYRETIRPKVSGTHGTPIRFESYPNESVYITGCDLISANKWQLYEGAIYSADVTDLGKVTQLFVGKERMKIARFPNNHSDDLMNPQWGTVAEMLAIQKPGICELTDPELAQTAVDLIGGDLWLLTGMKWVAFNSQVEWHDGSTIGFVFPGDAESYAYEPKVGSNYFVTGLLECLDAEQEWFYDANEKRVYFYAPGGVNPAYLNVQVRVREWGLNVSNRNFIETENINCFAAAVNMHDAENCLLDGAAVFYPVPFYPADSWNATETPQNATYSSIKIGGNDNIVRNCEVAYSWGEGIVVYGLGNNVENCLVHDMNWLATDAAPIHTSGSQHNLLHNTIYRAGRSGLVHRNSTMLEIAYNDIYNCGLLTTDLGATYCWQTDGDGTIIHHNWMHDVVTPAHTAGIYLDNGSANFLVHHNVVWNCDDIGIQTNLDAFNHEIYNNTIWDCSQAMGGSGGNEVIQNQIVYNNLSNAASWLGTDVQQNLTADDAHFVDMENGDFRLQADSPARDDYVITNGLLNGGFEGGTAGWSGAGSQLMSIEDPVHSGNLAIKSYERQQYWEGARQNITQVLKEHGKGRYSIEAWVKTAEGTTNAYLRFKIKDESGDSYPGTQKKCNADEWTKISYTGNLTWNETLIEAVFELMTTGGSNELGDIYIDDCKLTTPVSTDSTQPRGGFMISGITDDVTDDMPDAGAYEYGGANADWKAGSSLVPKPFNLPAGVNATCQNPAQFALQQNYPNPFNGHTTISYQLAQMATVELAVYNVLGEKVSTLVRAVQPAGFYTHTWNAKNTAGNVMPSGVYLYRLNITADGSASTQVKKMIYVR